MMNIFRKKTRYRGLIVCLLFFVNSIATAQILRDTSIIKQLPRISGWADNQHYIVEEWNQTLKDYDRIKVDMKTGSRSTISPVRKNIEYRVSIEKGDVYLLDGTEKKQITMTSTEEKLPVLSPDGRWVAFIRNNDLYAIELSSGREVRYTHDGSTTIMNGYASWVYYEEILGRGSQYAAFWWSPDSKHLAFFRFDDSDVPVVPLYRSEGQHGSVELTHYPKAGDPNPKVKVGIVPTAGGNIVWADFDAAEDQYFGTPYWRPDGAELLVQWMPREQNNLKLYWINLATGAQKEIYNEQQSTWINWIDRLRWVEDGFLMVRDFEGWEQIYHLSFDGKRKDRLTQGNNWNMQIVRIDQKSRVLYYKSNAELSTRTDLYRVQMDGRHQKRLTFGEYSHSRLLLSPDAQHLITSYSNSETPTRIALVNLKTGKRQDIADSKGRSFDTAALQRREVVWIKTPEGFELPGRIIWPKKLEGGKKYPVIINIYGGPKHQSVSDGWVDPLVSKEDSAVIRVSFDHRGAGHNGKIGLNYLHRNLGKWEMQDYISWVTWLRTNPHVDPNKIMITGGSYGGYLTALALTYGAEHFNYGIADYPVTDWALYDSHYTERYMDSPKDNPDGYRFGSVLTHADKYQSAGKSMLLIQHGTMDDNVHIQNTYQLTDAFQRLNKSFELMVYPGERHGWKGAKIPFTVNMRKRFQEQYLFADNKSSSREKMLDFTGITLEGEKFDSKAYRGKYLLLDFWGSWCMPCRKSHPHLKELYEQYHSDKFEFVGIAREFYQDDRAKTSWRRAVEQDGLPWPQLMNSELKQDLVKGYDIKTFPTKMLIHPDGSILWRGGSQATSELEEILKHIF